ncbi:MAG: hypothetical protein H6R34_462, partial [Bacteroidetes bacterium]|nr:hypothetical protein [Bacteroidota bacterium]
KFSPDEKHLDLMIDTGKEDEQMKSVHDEITSGRQDDKKSDEMEKEIEKKTRTELQLSFLITQIMHYLAILKK